MLKKVWITFLRWSRLPSLIGGHFSENIETLISQQPSVRFEIFFRRNLEIDELYNFRYKREGIKKFKMAASGRNKFSKF